MREYHLDVLVSLLKVVDALRRGDISFKLVVIHLLNDTTFAAHVADDGVFAVHPCDPLLGGGRNGIRLLGRFAVYPKRGHVWGKSLEDRLLWDIGRSDLRKHLRVLCRNCLLRSPDLPGCVVAEMRCLLKHRLRYLVLR